MQGSHAQVDSDNEPTDAEFGQFAARIAEEQGEAPYWADQHPSSRRSVEVVILDGETAGQTAFVARFHLRPVE